ncbi:MAG: hypothetical protein M3296_00350 [Actinomycetota bacterium]|nr:hypothetical protein [Actinomycetota bacterium]
MRRILEARGPFLLRIGVYDHLEATNAEEDPMTHMLLIHQAAAPTPRSPIHQAAAPAPRSPDGWQTGSEDERGGAVEVRPVMER